MQAMRAPFAQPVDIRRGEDMWREWMHTTSLDKVRRCALFDMHDVVDTLDKDQAIDVGVDLDHLESIGSVICSFGKSHRHGTFLT